MYKLEIYRGKTKTGTFPSALTKSAMNDVSGQPVFATGENTLPTTEKLLCTVRCQRGALFTKAMVASCKSPNL